MGFQSWNLSIGKTPKYDELMKMNNTMHNNLLQPGPTHVVPSLTARLRKVVVEILRTANSSND
jgi:hypothetical protein